MPIFSVLMIYFCILMHVVFVEIAISATLPPYTPARVIIPIASPSGSTMFIVTTDKTLTRVEGDIVIEKGEESKLQASIDFVRSSEENGALPDTTESSVADNGLNLIAMPGDGTELWPYGIVTYRIVNSSSADSGPNFTTSELTNIQTAMDDISSETGIKFITEAEAAAINFPIAKVLRIGNTNESGGGCYSRGTGFSATVNYVNLDRTANGTCRGVDVVIHELLHVLGVVHEQVNDNWEDNIDIFNSRITTGNESQFFSENSNNSLTSFDLSSIMMYDSYSFSICDDLSDPKWNTSSSNSPALVCRTSGWRTNASCLNDCATILDESGGLIGRQSSLSEKDIKGLRVMYHANAKVHDWVKQETGVLPTPSQIFRLKSQHMQAGCSVSGTIVERESCTDYACITVPSGEPSPFSKILDAKNIYLNHSTDGNGHCNASYSEDERQVCIEAHVRSSAIGSVVCSFRGFYY